MASSIPQEGATVIIAARAVIEESAAIEVPR